MIELRCLAKEEFARSVDKIVVLHDRAFKTKMTKEEICWKYLSNPVEGLFPFAAMDGERLAAFWAASPVILERNGQEILAAQTLNAMTDPDYEGQGLFSKLALEAINNFLRGKVSIIFGFPNNHSNRIHNSRFDYKTVAEVPMFMLDLQGYRETAERPCFDNSFKKEYLRYDVNDNLLHVKKDVTYLRWRYAENPVENYVNIVSEKASKVVAYAVCKIWRDRLNMVEFHVSDCKYAAELVNSCVFFAREQKCKYISLWTPVGNALHDALEKIGFSNTLPIHYFSAKTLDEKIADSELHNPHTWAIQLGDNNTY